MKNTTLTTLVFFLILGFSIGFFLFRPGLVPLGTALLGFLAGVAVGIFITAKNMLELMEQTGFKVVKADQPEKAEP